MSESTFGLPLRVVDDDVVADASGHLIADVFGRQSEIRKVRAEMIVRAVNCHDEMVRTITAYLDLFDQMANGLEVTPAQLLRARAEMEIARDKAHAEGR